VLRGVVGLEANATLVRQAVEASGGARSVGPSLLSAPIRPTFGDLGAASGRELLARVEAWEAGADQALAGHPWLRAASLRPVAAALGALARAGLTGVLPPETLWRLATMPVDDPTWVVEVGRAVAEPHRRLRVADGASGPAPDGSGGAAGWSLEQAERMAARARGLASLAGAFPGVGGLDRGALLGVEDAAARRITEVLGTEVARAGFGRCRNCRRVGAPWADECDRCGGRVPGALRRKASGGRARRR
jgi:hypothetical protein